MKNHDFSEKPRVSQRPTESRPQSALPKPSVLVVEDEPEVARAVKRTLTQLGYSVMGTARSGRVALEAMERERPSVVLSDIGISGDIDGVELAAIISERFGTPVVFLSAHGDEPTLTRATQARPYGYVMKPFKAHELRATLEVALTRHALDERLEQQSLTDDLTGLYNRRGFLVLAEQQLKIASRTGRATILVYADLNGMKLVNDTLGHEAGDELLLDAGRALRTTFRA